MSQMLLDYYKSIEESSRKMLDAAKSQDWDQVVRCEGVCAVLIEQLRVRSRSEQLLPELRGEKTKIMQRILFNDAQIRYLAEPWLEQLDEKSTEHPPFLH
jgi:flagellar protein FliT